MAHQIAMAAYCETINEEAENLIRCIMQQKIGSIAKVLGIVDEHLKRTQEARGQQAPGSNPSDLLIIMKANVALHHVAKWKRKESEANTEP